MASTPWQSKLHNSSGVFAPPGKRQPIPTIAICSSESIAIVVPSAGKPRLRIMAQVAQFRQPATQIHLPSARAIRGAERGQFVWGSIRCGQVQMPTLLYNKLLLAALVTLARCPSAMLAIHRPTGPGDIRFAGRASKRIRPNQQRAPRSCVRPSFPTNCVFAASI